MAGELNFLCAGAVKGLVLALQGDFERASGLRVHATFGAVGAIRDVLRSGAACDVFVASDAMIGSLQASGELRAATERAIGRVQTAIAVKASAPVPEIDSAESLKAALLACSALYFPDESALGCTQATEIRYTPGLALVGALPAPFALATVYSAAVASVARDDVGARSFIDLLAGASSSALRRAGGFDEATARSDA